MARCKKCESRLPEDARYCPECGRAVKKGSDQPSAGADRRRIRDAEDRIEYLEKVLDDNDIKFKRSDSDDDDDDRHRDEEDD